MVLSVDIQEYYKKVFPRNKLAKLVRFYLIKYFFLISFQMILSPNISCKEVFALKLWKLS